MIYADNFETLSSLFQSKHDGSNLADAQQIVNLLESVPNNTLVLLSSRIAKNLASERMVDLDGLSDEEGAEMFIRLAQNYFLKKPSEKMKYVLEELSEKTGGPVFPMIWD